jgi:flagellar basal-body rod protein FlgF
MENTSYIVLSQQTALHRQMDVIANNLANASTAGFKSERTMFAELLQPQTDATGIPGGAARPSFVQQLGTLRDLRDGGLINTGNTLDLAIHGPGYFAVETPAGVRFTRDGNLHLNAQGQIVNAEGFPLLDESNRPISIRSGETRIEISRSGRVATEGGEAGRIRIAQFENEQAMRPIGGTLYETDASPAAPNPKTEIRQGMVEGSNVQPILEISNMIEVMRRYQSAQIMAEGEHDRIRKAIDKLSHVG